MKTLPSLLLALAIVSLPLAVGCWQCEGGPVWHRYAMDLAAVTIDASTPTLVPLTVSAPPGTSTDSIAIELGMTDCAAGPFTLDVRLLRADGTAIAARDGFSSTGSTPNALRCPDQGVVFQVPSSELTCAGGGARCAATFSVELTSERGVGPREVEARLVDDDCNASVRSDGAIDAWGI